MAVGKYLDASTGYVTERDCELLDDNNCPIVVYEYEYGHWVHVPSRNDDDYQERLEELEEFEFSTKFLALIAYAASKQCWWIKLDVDGDDGLPLHFEMW